MTNHPPHFVLPGYPILLAVTASHNLDVVLGFERQTVLLVNKYPIKNEASTSKTSSDTHSSTVTFLYSEQLFTAVKTEGVVDQQWLCDYTWSCQNACKSLNINREQTALETQEVFQESRTHLLSLYSATLYVTDIDCSLCVSETELKSFSSLRPQRHLLLTMRVRFYLFIYLHTYMVEYQIIA